MLKLHLSDRRIYHLADHQVLLSVPQSILQQVPVSAVYREHQGATVFYLKQ